MDHERIVNILIQMVSSFNNRQTRHPLNLMNKIQIIRNLTLAGNMAGNSELDKACWTWKQNQLVSSIMFVYNLGRLVVTRPMFVQAKRT
ncbi:hypothetical protein RO3G_13997 [Rhizopus delemar RA 99-880]|uniref:Uncharacterized protein n=1 Tax=Rhizopus delemar (strain RA 99-880 / ATCC MYA-4621 / FGSC 9543 / NRRL 43880) TaxID=246409 RepID=I1CLF6_RHIO9|nr:hypothetical protein RO3G_13997 [Rhizopus delemar RA 99-880]|eukprot:EIE89286.1 hypothetical protein RO3G_13997 [Rhizopus delemar RA 99-880]